MYWINRFYGPRMHFSPDDGSGGSAAPSPAPGASAPSPSSAESSSPAGGTSTESGDAADTFSEFSSDDDFDSVEVPLGSDPTVVPPPVAAPAAVVPPKPAATPVAPAEVPPVVAAAPASERQAPPASPIEAALSGMSQNRQALADHMAATTFALSPEEIAQFETDAVGMIPKLMAKVHVEATMNTLSLINKMVPGLIDARVDSTSSAKTKATEAKNEFYTTNSDLNEKDHGPLLDKWAKAFRAQNPTASRQEAIKFVGQAIRTELGLPALVAGAKTPARPQAFTPARPGAKPPTHSTDVDTNQYAGLGTDIED